MMDKDVGDLILELNRLWREWEETLGSGAGLEEGQLQQENMRLKQEKYQLLRQKNQLARDNNQLRQEKVRFTRQKNVIHLKSQILADEKIELEARNSRLTQELKKCRERTTIETLTIPTPFTDY